MPVSVSNNRIDSDITDGRRRWIYNLSGSGHAEAPLNDFYFFRLEERELYAEYQLIRQGSGLLSNTYIAVGAWGKINGNKNRGAKQEARARAMLRRLFHYMEEVLTRNGWQWVVPTGSGASHVYQRSTPPANLTETVSQFVDTSAGTAECASTDHTERETDLHDMYEENGPSLRHNNPGESVAPSDLKRQLTRQAAEVSRADLAERHPGIGGRREVSDRYIAQIIGRCRYCGAAMIVELSQDTAVCALLSAIKEASGPCDANHVRAQIERGSSPREEGREESFFIL